MIWKKLIYIDSCEYILKLKKIRILIITFHIERKRRRSCLLNHSACNVFSVVPTDKHIYRCISRSISNDCFGVVGTEVRFRSFHRHGDNIIIILLLLLLVGIFERHPALALSFNQAAGDRDDCKFHKRSDETL